MFTMGRLLVLLSVAVFLVEGGRARDGVGKSLQDTPGHGVAGESPHRVRARSADDQAVTLNWNSVVDIILQDAKKEILKQNLDEIALPDVEEEFRRKWSFILIDSRFVARRGHLKSFSSIERDGEATVSIRGPVYTLTSDISMRVAKIRYEHYDVEMWQQSIFSGDIRGNIGSNRVRVVLDFEMKDTECLSSLREVKVLSIGGFEVEVSGLGPLDELASQISSWVSKKREGQIIKEIEYYLSKEIRKALEDFQCDEYAGLLMLSF